MIAGVCQLILTLQPKEVVVTWLIYPGTTILVPAAMLYSLDQGPTPQLFFALILKRKFASSKMLDLV